MTKGYPTHTLSSSFVLTCFINVLQTLLLVLLVIHSSKITLQNKPSLRCCKCIGLSSTSTKKGDQHKRVTYSIVSECHLKHNILLALQH